MLYMLICLYAYKLISLYANNSVKIPLDYFPLRGAKVKKNLNNKTAAENSTAVKENMNFTVLDFRSTHRSGLCSVLRSSGRTMVLYRPAEPEPFAGPP